VTRRASAPLETDLLAGFSLFPGLDCRQLKRAFASRPPLASGFSNGNDSLPKSAFKLVSMMPMLCSV